MAVADGLWGIPVVQYVHACMSGERHEYYNNETFQIHVCALTKIDLCRCELPNLPQSVVFDEADVLWPFVPPIQERWSDMPAIDSMSTGQAECLMHISQLMPADDERIRDHPLSAPAAGFNARQVKWSYVIDEVYCFESPVSNVSGQIYLMDAPPSCQPEQPTGAQRLLL